MLASAGLLRVSPSDGVQPHTLYPVRKGIRDCFSYYIVACIHVTIDESASLGFKQPACDAYASVLMLIGNGFYIQEATLAGIGLICIPYPNTHLRSFVVNFFNQVIKGDEDEILCGSFAQANSLFPVFVTANDERVNVMGLTPVHHKATDFMEIMRT